MYPGIVGITTSYILRFQYYCFIWCGNFVKLAQVLQFCVFTEKRTKTKIIFWTGIFAISFLLFFFSLPVCYRYEWQWCSFLVYEFFYAFVDIFTADLRNLYRYLFTLFKGMRFHGVPLSFACVARIFLMYI